MVLNFALAGRSRIQSALDNLRHRPGYALGLVVGAVIAIAVTPVWGALHPWAGWHRMRSRLEADGFIALGEVLAPSGALDDYKDGIWSGLWRVHGSSLGFFLLQAPIIYLLIQPYELAQQLFGPVSDAYTGHPEMAKLIAVGIPAFFLVSAISVIFAQHLIAWRMLGGLRGPHKIGTMFKVTGASWRETLGSTQVVISLAILAGLTAAIGVAFGGVNEWLADAANLYRPSIITDWIQKAVMLVAGSLFLEAFGKLSSEADCSVVAPAQPYSFTAWLVAWIQQVFDWLTQRGLYVIGVGAVFSVGLVTALDAINGFSALGVFFEEGPIEAIIALHGGGAWADGSWGGLGWFVAAALILLHIRKNGGES
jgi:hypothetical protein